MDIKVNDYYLLIDPNYPTLRILELFGDWIFEGFIWFLVGEIKHIRSVI